MALYHYEDLVARRERLIQVFRERPTLRNLMKIEPKYITQQMCDSLLPCSFNEFSCDSYEWVVDFIDRCGCWDYNLVFPEDISTGLYQYCLEEMQGEMADWKDESKITYSELQEVSHEDEILNFFRAPSLRNLRCVPESLRTTDMCARLAPYIRYDCEVEEFFWIVPKWCVTQKICDVIFKSNPTIWTVQFFDHFFTKQMYKELKHRRVMGLKKVLKKVDWMALKEAVDKEMVGLKERLLMRNESVVDELDLPLLFEQ